ncbi:hypothetical protein BaRGS_00010514 [Batillaria attramentaria]|uniref:Uncharacterized protein n=1 Tax=Batillaria attramentaria TaxID=370345 RepID=A0ABD0LFA2_9CAEN
MACQLAYLEGRTCGGVPTLGNTCEATVIWGHRVNHTSRSYGVTTDNTEQAEQALDQCRPYDRQIVSYLSSSVRLGFLLCSNHAAFLAIMVDQNRWYEMQMT